MKIIDKHGENLTHAVLMATGLPEEISASDFIAWSIDKKTIAPVEGKENIYHFEQSIGSFFKHYPEDDRMVSFEDDAEKPTDARKMAQAIFTSDDPYQVAEDLGPTALKELGNYVWGKSESSEVRENGLGLSPSQLTELVILCTIAKQFKAMMG